MVRELLQVVKYTKQYLSWYNNVSDFRHHRISVENNFLFRCAIQTNKYFVGDYSTLVNSPFKRMIASKYNYAITNSNSRTIDTGHDYNCWKSSIYLSSI